MRYSPTAEQVRAQDGAWDGAITLAIFVAYLSLLQAAPHLDGVRWTDAIERYELIVNPNYLLMQPLAVAGYSVWTWLGGVEDAIYFGKVFDAVFAGASLLIFAATLRALKLPALHRAAALVIVAFSFNFLELATSNHIKMATGPFLFGALHLLTLYAMTPTTRLAVAAGALMAAAVCSLANAAVWAAIAGLVILAATPGDLSARLKNGVAYGATVAAATLTLVLGFYIVSGERDQSIVEWFTSYDAGDDSGFYGYAGVSALTIGRFAFSLIKTFVHAPDLSAVVKATLTGADAPPLSDWVALNIVSLIVVGGALATLTALAVVAAAAPALVRDARRRDAAVVLTMLGMFVAFALFGFYWNDSDEEFWFQLAPPIALLAALGAHRAAPERLGGVLIALAALAVAANQFFSYAAPRAAYPYDANLAAISEEVAACDLTIFDRTGVEYGLVASQASEFLPIFAFSEINGFSIDQVTQAFEERLAQAAAAGAQVCVLGLYDSSDLRFPWSSLSERAGIERSAMIDLIDQRFARGGESIVGGERVTRLDAR